MDIKFRIFGLPESEAGCIREYLKTYNAKRYLSGYTNDRIKRVLIQIGMDKTASTSIQSFLAENQELLHRDSVEYKTNWGGINHSVPLKSIFGERPERIYHHISSGFKKKQIAGYNCKNMISLCHGIRECRQETYIFFGEGICSFTKREFMRLRKMLHDLMPEARIELMHCVRSNTGYASSAYQQAVKIGRYHDEMDIIKRYSNIYKKRLTNAIEVFGKDKLTVYKFEDTVRHRYGPVGYFIEKAGISATALEYTEIPKRNTAVSHHAIEIIEFINKRYPRVIKGSKNKSREPKDTDPILQISGTGFRLSDNVGAMIVEKAKSDIHWLKDNFGIEYPTVYEQTGVTELEYGNSYYADCIRAFEGLNDFLKGVFQDFILFKMKDAESERHFEIFSKINDYMTGGNDADIKAYLIKKNYKSIKSLQAYSNPNIKRVVIQIGMDKTASTSIQLFLSRNREWLNQNSLEYKTDWGADNHSVPLKSLFSKKPEKVYWHIISGNDRDWIFDYNLRNLTALCEGIRQCRQETYIFFGEGIYGFRIGELLAFKRLIKTLMPMAKIEILHCVRNNSGYASSGYQQAVKMGRFYSKSKLMLIYSNIYLRRIIRPMLVFGKKNMSVYKFEDTLLHEFGPAGYFIRMLGKPTRELVRLEIPKANEGISFQAVEIIEFINKREPLVAGENTNDKRYKGDTDAISKIEGCKYRLSEKVQKNIVRLSFFDLLWLRMSFGIRYPMVHDSKEDVRVNYDENYCKMFLAGFLGSGEYIKLCLYDFVKMKINDSGDNEHKEIFIWLKGYIENLNKEMIEEV